MKKSLIFRGKQIRSVGFFGLGKSNIALFNYLSENYGALSFTLRSDNEIPRPNGFGRVFFGSAARENITEELLFLSPSVRRDAPEFTAPCERGVIFSSDVEFFFENKKIPVFAVTGSDGKSTTAALAALMLSSDSGDFPASANIGLPMTSLLSREGLAGTVAELSSFQLMDFRQKTERALITNLSENHLDWHTSLSEYENAKENLIRFAQKRIFNLDCPYNLRLSEKYPAYAVFSRKMSYGEMRRRITANHYFYLEDGYISESGSRLFEREKIKISGEHNLSNFLGAMALASELVTTEKMLWAAEKFEGLAHRTRLVGIYGGIAFYDSSIDSTPTRTATTLKSLSRPTVLILGGRGKKLSYEPLFPLPESVKTVVLTGENRGELLDAFVRYGERAKECPNIFSEERFSDAVLLALKQASEGDAVLLSPASTSFDSFSDYKERGDTFSGIIKNFYAES